MHKKFVLVINPGSTSTKISVFEGSKEKFTHTIVHAMELLLRFPHIMDQFEFRYAEILKFLDEKGILVHEFVAVIGRGGLLRPLEGGIYTVNEKMIQELNNRSFEEHASNLGAIIADAIAKQAGVKAYIADPVVVDEMEDIARITGLPDYPKSSRFHALNQKAMARRAAAALGKPYASLNLIVAHLGGGISIGAHRQGRVVDVNEALYGDGPFSPERAGKLATRTVMDLCFKKGASPQSVKTRLVGQGGLAAHCGTQNAIEIEAQILAGNRHFEQVYRAMAYQIAKEIGSCAVIFSGHVDAIVITGGLAYSKLLTDWLLGWISFIGPVFVYPGENEMQALNEAVLRVLKGEETAKTYS